MIIHFYLKYIEFYSKYLKEYGIIESNKFSSRKENFILLINQKPKEGFEIFLNLLINKILSNCTKENYFNQNKELIKKFSIDH